MTATPRRADVRAVGRAYRATRIDYADETSKNMGSHLKALKPSSRA